MSTPDAVPPSDLAAMRVNYGEPPELTETDLSDGWEPLLRRWISDAAAASVVEPNAMVLSTVDSDGHPAARTVLCKQLPADGVVFYTNYESDKARQLAATQFAALTFTWPEIARQVRLRGPVTRVAADRTADYWRGRPRGSQLGAWASDQSRPVTSRAELERALAQATDRFADVEEIPVPPHWGGYLLAPVEVEFWQGRDSRLHNRLRLTRAPDNTWRTTRLQP